MVGFFSHKSSLKKWLSLLLAAALLLTGLMGFAPSAQAICGPHSVTLPEGEGFALTAKDGAPLAPGKYSVADGEDFAFGVVVSEGYQGDKLAVKANGITLNAVSGVYTIEDVTGDIAIEIEGVVAAPKPPAASYQVTLPKNDGKYTIAAEKGFDPQAVPEGGRFVFTLTPNKTYAGVVPVVKGNGQTLIGGEKNGVWRYAIADIRCDISITVNDSDWQACGVEYIVTLPTGKGFELKDIKGGVDLGNMQFGVVKNGGITFKIDVKKGYDASKLVVKANGLTMTPNSKGVYGISSIKTDVKVTVDLPAVCAQYIVSLPCGEGYAVKNIKGGIDLGGLQFAVNRKDSLSFQVDVEKGYDAARLVVKANGNVVSPDKKGVYTLKNIREDINVTIGFDARQSEKFTLTDAATRVRVSGYSYTTPKLYVDKIASSSSAYKAMLKQANGLPVLGAYDVVLKNADLDGKATVSFRVDSSLNGEKVRILHLVNGKVEKRLATVKNGRAAISLDSLSPFMVTGPAKDVINPPKTGDNTPAMAGWLMLLGAQALLYMAVRRRGGKNMI